MHAESVAVAELGRARLQFGAGADEARYYYTRRESAHCTAMRALTPSSAPPGRWAKDFAIAVRSRSCEGQTGLV